MENGGSPIDYVQITSEPNFKGGAVGTGSGRREPTQCAGERDDFLCALGRKGALRFIHESQIAGSQQLMLDAEASIGLSWALRST